MPTESESTGHLGRPIAPNGSPQVRFASTNEEIEPLSNPLASDPASNQQFGADETQLKELSQNLQNTQLQGRRMSQFAFEPVSLPASRVRRRNIIILREYGRSELGTSENSY